MGNNLLCCCKGDYLVNNAEIREDNNRSRAGRLQNSMKINTEINDFTKKAPQLGNLNNLKDFNTCDISNDNIYDEDLLMPIEERKAKLLKLESSADKLTIEISNKNFQISGQKLSITCRGLVNSLRKENDGLVYFGCINQDLIINDYLIKLPDSEFDERCLGRHFQIQFRLSDMKYYIRDLGKGFGAFMRISELYQLKTDSLINIGDSYIVVSIGEEDIKSNNEENNACVTDVSQCLTLKIFSGTFKFDPM